MEGKGNNYNKGIWFSIMALILILIPIFFEILWYLVCKSNPSAEQAERVDIYFSNFPTFMNSKLSNGLVTFF